MHYMLHIPQQIVYLGPLVRYCCLRFEARHRYFEDLAPLQNFKNICLSLADRCQLDVCADLETETPCQHPLFKPEKVIGPSSKVADNLRAHFFQRITDCILYANPKRLINVFSCQWIQLQGTRYVPNKCCIQRPRKHFESGGALAKRGTFVYDQNQTILCRSRTERKFLKIWSLCNVGNGLYRVFTTAKRALSFQQKRAFIKKHFFRSVNGAL